MSDPNKFYCKDENSGHCGPSNPIVYNYIRKAYCPTTYFNASSPDQYTYLQY